MVRRPTVRRLFGLILFCAFLACALCGVTAVASAETRDVELSFDVTRDGDEVSAAVTVMKNDGIVDLYLRVEYDTEALELTKSTFGHALSSLGPVDNFEKDEYVYPYRVIYLGNENSDDTGLLLTLRFKVKEGAKNGAHSVKLVVRQVGYLEDEDSVEPVYNEKYGAPLSYAAELSETTTGGKVVAEKAVVTSKGAVVEVREPDQTSDKTVMICLIVGGAVIFIAAGVIAYLFYRKKNVRTNNK